MACKPLVFEGASDPIKSLEWLKGIEKVFRVSKCVVRDKVNYATALLTGNAMMWWDSMTNAFGQELVDSLNWEQFKIKFHNQYCPPDVMIKIEQEFMELKQGSMSVTDYEL